MEALKIKPTKFTPLTATDIKEEAIKLTARHEAIEHDTLLGTLKEYIELVDFQKVAFPQTEIIINKIARLEGELRESDGRLKPGNETESTRAAIIRLTEELDGFKVKQKHYIIIVIEKILELAQNNKWGICINNEFVYLYNGAYWALFENAQLQAFFGEAAEKMGVIKWEAKFFAFRDQLFKQFLAVANLPTPKPQKKLVLINLKNGTFQIGAEKQELRAPERKDFITYQLPFEYNPKAECPLFRSFLDKVQPDIERQKILAEYIASVFISPSALKLEKALLLYGSGANGKSVFFEIINALLGPENVSSYSLQSLTDIERGGPYRAKIANKLVNYASEINGKLDTSIFKAMVSGEPIEAKALYSQPFQITQYAKLIFNCNELPKDVEQTHAYFRRFLIIPFDVTIPEREQDRELSSKIISKELSGVFNWVLDGLTRLLKQQGFTNSEAVEKQLEQYKKQSDSVQMFIEEEGYTKSNLAKPLKEVFVEYRGFCNESGYMPVSIRTIGERLRHAGMDVKRGNKGNIVYMQKDAA